MHSTSGSRTISTQRFRKRRDYQEQLATARAYAPFASDGSPCPGRLDVGQVACSDLTRRVRLMGVCLIEVPYTVGDEYQAASLGPQRYLEAGAQQLLASRGVSIVVKRVPRGTKFRDSVSASLAVGKELAKIVSEVVAEGQFPLVVAGSCDVAMGVLSGINHAGCGVVWIDAHGDFNTPNSTVSGFFPGMALAVITGHCYQNVWAQIGNAAPVPESMTLLLGVRDLSPAEERRRLESSDIQVVPWREGRPQQDVLASLDELANRVRKVYVHIDNDAFDPQVAPGVSDDPVAGGMSLHDMEDVIRAVAERFQVKAAALTNYNPNHDPDERTLRAGLSVLQLLGELSHLQGAG
jgi:arginase